MTSLRLATYNIHKFVGADGKRNPARTLKVIEALDADVLAIQEFQADSDTRRPRGRPESAEVFAEAAGYHVVQQPVRRVVGNYQSNLLLSRLPVHHSALLDLHHRRAEPRGAICADIEADGHLLRIVGTHLGLTPAGRRAQLERILKECHPHEGQFFALMGDLNAWIPWGPVDRRLRREFRGHARPVSFPAMRPVLPLDRILVTPPKSVEKTFAFAEDLATTASDHLPVVCDVTLH